MNKNENIISKQCIHDIKSLNWATHSVSKRIEKYISDYVNFPDIYEYLTEAKKIIDEYNVLAKSLSLLKCEERNSPNYKMYMYAKLPMIVYIKEFDKRVKENVKKFNPNWMSSMRNYDLHLTDLSNAIARIYKLISDELKYISIIHQLSIAEHKYSYIDDSFDKMDK